MSLISIAMTTYNGEKFLREQLDSILQQTLSNFELIISDDCSKDSTWKILEEYKQKDSRIHIYKNEQNIGFKKNFEKAINLCKSNYIALSDQDDIWEANHLSLLYDNLGAASISCANAFLIDSNGKRKKELLNENEGLFLFENRSSKFLYRVLLKGNCLQGASMLMPAQFVKGCLPIPEKVLYHDAWFATCACFENGINYSFEVVNNYRQHGENVTFTSHNKHTISFFQKMKTRVSILFSVTRTDRLDYIIELEKRYGLQNKDFIMIKAIIDDIVAKKFSIKDILFLWKNYYYINTKKSHKGFFKSILVWKKWHPFIMDSKK